MIISMLTCIMITWYGQHYGPEEYNAIMFISWLGL